MLGGADQENSEIGGQRLLFLLCPKTVYFFRFRGFNSSRVAGRSTRLQRADYPLGASIRTSSKTR